MLIQRSDWPSPEANSTTSTLGRSGSDGRVTTPPRVRAVRLRRGLGRLGMGTSRLGGHRRQHENSLWNAVYLRLAVSRTVAKVIDHIAGHIQRGGGTGPLKPRQPPA